MFSVRFKKSTFCKKNNTVRLNVCDFLNRKCCFDVFIINSNLSITPKSWVSPNDFDYLSVMIRNLMYIFSIHIFKFRIDIKFMVLINYNDL